MNREMLKEAIAEAKTIKETAIANAKAALEEAFTPQLTAMFAERLNEEEDEEEMKNEGKDNTTDLEEASMEDLFNLEEILAELSETEETDEAMKMDDTMEGLDEDLMLEEMSDEEIEELVMKVIDDMIETGKLMPGEGEEEEDLEDVEDLDGDEIEVGDEEEVELDELLNELMSEEEKEVKEGLLDKITSFFGSVLGDFERENKDLISKFQNSAKTAEDKKELIDALTAWGRKNQIEGPYIQAARTAASEKYGLGLKGGSTTASMGTFEEAKEMEDTIN
jgi:hypothetical protein